jgi:hypothetical protein
MRLLIQDRQANNQNRDYQVVGNVFAEVDFLKHFTLRTSAGGTFDIITTTDLQQHHMKMQKIIMLPTCILKHTDRVPA